MGITKETISKASDGREIIEYTLINENGFSVKIMNYGAIIRSMMVPDKNGNFEDIVLGFSDYESYVSNDYLPGCYFGAVVGRYGNRIAKGKFSLDGQEYSLVCNNGPNHLHGGLKGFDKRVWDSRIISEEKEPCVEMTYISMDGEEGYPGELNISVRYLLSNENELMVEYSGSIDKACPVNVTQHSYFNLSACKKDVLDHEVVIHADRFTVVDETLIPTGELRSVEDGPMDFRTVHKIGERIDQVEGGYDHNFVLINQSGELAKIAEVYERESGRFMEVFTTEPGVQFYTGNFLDGSLVGKEGIQYNKHYGFCLETQHYPDSPNQETFPNVVLRPGEKYQHKTIFKFSVR